MAFLRETTINGNLTITSTLQLPYKNSTFLNGFQTAPIKIDNATDTSNYYPWIIQKNTGNSEMFTMGLYQNYFIIAGSTTSRTTNGYDNALFFNANTGEVKLNNNYLFLHTGNYKNYVPTKTGSGASGTWGINISGNAASLSSTLPVNKGGTGNTSFTANRLVYYNGSKLVSSSNINISTTSIGIDMSDKTTIAVRAKNANNSVDVRAATAAGLYHNTAAGSSTAKWLIYINTSGTVSANTSDRRKKKYIEDTTEFEAISILKNIKIRNFIYKEDIGHNNLIQNGIFAQDLRDLMKHYNLGNRPWLQWHYNNDDDIYYDISKIEDENMTYEINYSSFVPLLIKGWQINENKISHLKDKIKELEGM